MAIIAISGKKGSGKDTVGNIIQYLTAYGKYSSFEQFMQRTPRNAGNPWGIKKFADPLKDMLCILLNCTRDNLEDEEFKSKELPEEWWYYKIADKILPRFYYPNKIDNDICEARYLVKPTPRLLLTQMGTECGRDILHPNLWVNALFSQYNPTGEFNYIDDKTIYPKWIITDLRFPNEMKAVRDRDGITIRVERQVDSKNRPIIRENEHESETALDNEGFHYLIHNSCSIKILIQLVKEILIKEGIIDV